MLVPVFVLTSVLFSHVLAETPTVCPFGYEQVSTHCFKLLRESLSFFDATVACDVIDGRVVQVVSDDVQDYVTGFLKSQTSPPENIWMGATDLQQEQHWIPLSSKYADALVNWGHWAPSYPRMDLDKNCAVLNVANYWRWRDTSCDQANGVLCHVALATPSADPAG